jgi:hypothetical protein
MQKKNVCRRRYQSDKTWIKETETSKNITVLPAQFFVVDKPTNTMK